MRRSVFLTPTEAELLRERQEERRAFRITGRDAAGNARLRDQADIMDAVERLCQLEDELCGPLLCGPSAYQHRHSEIARELWQKRKEG